MMEDSNALRRVWRVDALCRALADTLNARFNPVRVTGELSGFSRAASGHCYFSLKDQDAQIRCAMFKRAATSLDFAPRDGELVEVSGRLDIYGPRGDLQLIVESMRRQGQGTLFEEFVRLKTRLEAQGLFDPARKRPLPAMPRSIGLVTSLGAAALHDVATALRRRVPHIPVFLAPAAVQGEAAPGELVRSMQALMSRASDIDGRGTPLDVILLVRGGGSMEDLWAFNDEQLALTICACPVPVVSGVGHETDFTIADFVADVRAPTPTAAAELVATPAAICEAAAGLLMERLESATHRTLDTQAQRLDRVAVRAGRPSGLVAAHSMRLQSLGHSLRAATLNQLRAESARSQNLTVKLPAVRQALYRSHIERVQRAELQLGLLDPSLVLKRGYAWLTNSEGVAITSVGGLEPGQQVHATLSDGTVDLSVQAARLN
ncbi:XseA Exonuclease VII, large subunit [Comamonadaceae bacterium]